MPRRPLTSAIGLVSAVLAVVSGTVAAQAAPPHLVEATPFTYARAVGDGMAIQLDAAVLGAAAMSPTSSFLVRGFPLTPGRDIDMELASFPVTGPETRFVKGAPGGVGPDQPLDFDHAAIQFYRGRVLGYPASHVIMAVSEQYGSMARIDLGPGERRFLMSSIGGSTMPLRAGELAVFEARTSRRGTSLLVPFCGVSWSPLDSVPDRPGGTGPDVEGAGGPPGGIGDSGRGGPTLNRSSRRMRLAVETDYEYFELFGNLEDAGAYVVQLYGVVSDIFLRDINTRVELSFVRLWDTPDDLFNQADPLVPFRQYWNQNMGHVAREVAQFLSGRRDLPAGGTAYLDSVCSGTAYSWSGYTLGFMGDPDRPDWINGDIIVTAHELGHNFGSRHTQDYNLDQCHQGGLTPRRGSIMSYCGQTFSGGDLLHDLWLHERTAQEMRSYVYSRTCVVLDCNGNGIADSVDISSGTSQDVNGNGIPDECEDCNGNGQLDPLDIAQGISLDSNNNGIPDECECDCNGNGVPDTRDIALGTSLDLNANRIPDECEPDCDADGTADYHQVQADMTLDLDRNLILDSCQRCDPAGPTDLVALDRAWNCYVANTATDGAVREFLAASGVLVNATPDGTALDAQDLIILPSRRILVSLGAANKVIELAPDGTVVGDFIAAGAGGVSFPTGLLRTSRGSILVASRDNNSVREYDEQTGAFLGVFVSTAPASFAAPFGMAFGANGNLFVTSSTNRVHEFNGDTGAFVRIFVTLNSGGLSDPRGILFKPDGNLLVCSRGSNRVLEYNGTTGAFLRQWNRQGTATIMTLDEPWGIRLGPDGDVYVSRSGASRGGGEGELHLTNARIYHFDIRNGNFVRAYLMGTDGSLFHPTGFDFMPGDATDCNRNHFPDNCDISHGYSRDVNRNGRPDECDCLADWNGDQVVSSMDISAFVTAWLRGVGAGSDEGDFNGDFAVNSTDISAFITAWLTAVMHGC